MQHALYYGNKHNLDITGDACMHNYGYYQYPNSKLFNMYMYTLVMIAEKRYI
jgi:hypothetical protein